MTQIEGFAASRVVAIHGGYTRLCQSQGVAAGASRANACLYPIKLNRHSREEAGGTALEGHFVYGQCGAPVRREKNGSRETKQTTLQRAAG